MVVFFIPAGLSAADDKATMGNTAVVTLHLFLGNKMHRGIVVCKVVRHCLDGIFHCCRIRAFLQYYKAFSGVFFSGGEVLVFTASNRCQCAFHRNGVLLGILYAGNTAHCIGMSLAHAFAPESIIFSGGQNCSRIHTVQRKHSRVPAYGDDSHLAGFFRRCIYIGKMLRDSCVGVKAVNNIKPLHILRGLLRQIRGTSAA